MLAGRDASFICWCLGCSRIIFREGVQLIHRRIESLVAPVENGLKQVRHPLVLEMLAWVQVKQNGQKYLVEQIALLTQNGLTKVYWVGDCYQYWRMRSNLCFQRSRGLSGNGNGMGAASTDKDKFQATLALTIQNWINIAGHHAMNRFVGGPTT